MDDLWVRGAASIVALVLVVASANDAPTWAWWLLFGAGMAGMGFVVYKRRNE